MAYVGWRIGVGTGRFAALRERGGRVRQLSYCDVFLFDVRASRGEDARLAAERIRSLSAAGLYLVASQTICAIVLSLYALDPGFTGNPLAVLSCVGTVVALSLAAWLFLSRKRSKHLAPHFVVRLWGVLTLAIGALWCLLLAVGLGDQAPPDVVYASLFAAFAFTIVAFMPVPILMVASCFVALIALFLFSDDRQLLGLIAAFGGCLLMASIFGARGALIAAGRQLMSEFQAKRASRFVTEFEQSGRGWFWETDADGALTYVSDRLAEDLGCAPGDLAGKEFITLLGLDDAPGDDRSEMTLGFHLSSHLPFVDVTVKAKEAASTGWSLSGTPHFDEYGRFLGFSGIGADLTEKRRAEAEIHKLARYDGLTGLPNRMLMRMTLDEALRGIEKQKKGAAVFLIDLDRFKNVNDTLGHPVGDALLKEVAQRLTSVIGNDGQVGRIGGDEFKAVFPTADSEVWLGSIAERLIREVSAPYKIDGHNVSIGASIGIAIAHTQYQCADALIRDADLALYAAKADGRGTYKLFAADMHSEAQDRQFLEQDLRGAVERGELRVVYQPVVNTRTEEVVGFEALARWTHPQRGPVRTDLFISIAEECGLIASIGEWVLRTACEEAAAWPSQLRIAVNISPIQFANPNLVTTVINVLASTGLDPERLELEITEGVFLSDSESLDESFKRLKAAGVRIALDDFGTGYSSLGYLKRAPLNKIKIDQSFVRGAAATGSTSEAILRSIISLAQSLKMDTTAEGVETHDDLRLIRELGCSQVQGFIFGKPMEAAEARELAAKTESVAAQGYENARPTRYRLIRRAVVQWNGMSFDVRVRNISTGGALIESKRGVPIGAVIQLDLAGCGSFGAEIRWSDDERFGIKFERPFNLSVLRSEQEGRSAATVLQPAYLKSETSADSPWAGRTARLSPAEMKRTG
jgi:diguanylate cyclase (GGDEF)-like protein/PAS domain S-box-containing protein